MRSIRKSSRVVVALALAGTAAGAIAGFVKTRGSASDAPHDARTRVLRPGASGTARVAFDKTVLPKGGAHEVARPVAIGGGGAAQGRLESLRGQLSSALGEHDATQRRQRLSELGRLAAKLDPTAARELAAGMRPDDRAAFLTGVVSEIVRTDPQEGLRFAAAETSLSLRAGLTATAIAALTQRDPVAAGRWISEQPAGAVRDRALASFIEAWSSTDPAAAAEWLMAMSDDRIGRSEATSTLMRGWVERDPRAAAEWALALPEGPERSSAVAALMEQWADRAPRDAARWAEQQIGTRHEREAIGNLASRWGYADPESAIGWLAGLPDATAHAGEAAAVMSYLAESQPSRAVEVAANLPPGMQETAINSIAGTWSAMDPDVALEWVETITDPGARADAYRSAMEMWTMRSPDEVMAYIDAQPAGADRDAAIEAYTNPGAHGDLTPLLDLALTMDDAQARADRVAFLYGQLQQSDPNAAAQWLANADVPGDLRRRLG